MYFCPVLKDGEKVAADKSTQDSMYPVSHQRLVIWMLNILSIPWILHQIHAHNQCVSCYNGFCNPHLIHSCKKKVLIELPTSGCNIIKPPTCAIASTIRTSGIIGPSWKWPGTKLSFIVTFLMATTDTPGLYFTTRSTSKNGNLWGKIF
jgi:hypothetical protein